MEYSCDVLIVGGGLAGGSLALALQSTGLKVILVEAVSDAQREASPMGDRALALAQGTVQSLEQLAVWQAVAAQAAPIEQIHISDRGHFGKVRLSAEQVGVTALGAVITARPLECQIAKMVSDSSIETLCPGRVTGLKAGPESVCVSVTVDNQPATVTARLVVGADGGNSSVRKLLEIGQTCYDYGQSAIVTEVKPEYSPQATAFERFTPSGPVALLPLPDDRYAVIWSLQHEEAERMIALSEQAFIERLQDTFGHWRGHLTLCATPRKFPLKLVVAERMIDSRVVLIGNAVHQLHPVAGQGYNLGMRDVTQLAELLIEADRQGDDPGSDRLLERYQTARQADHQRVIGFTDHLVRLFSNEWFSFGPARNLGLLALDHLPWAKHKVVHQLMGMGGRTPRLNRQEVA